MGYRKLKMFLRAVTTRQRRIDGILSCNRMLEYQMVLDCYNDQCMHIPVHQKVENACPSVNQYIPECIKLFAALQETYPVNETQMTNFERAQIVSRGI